MRLGLIGLGKMGSRIALKLLREGHEVVAWTRSESTISNFKFKISNSQSGKKLKIAKSVQDLINSLNLPRTVWLMVDANATGEVLDEVLKYVEKGDIIIDGGNSYYKDTQRRFENLKKRGIKFLGIGVSGGIIAEKQGYPLMVGGDVSAYQYITTILNSLSKPARHASKALRAGPHGGHEYFGEGGAGHFVKMVHNAIEYGYMEAIGEGFGLLDSSEYNFNLKKIAEIYQKGSLVSGFMMERTIEVLRKDPKLQGLRGIIGKATGETIWAVEEAEKKDLLFEIIKRSLEIRNESEKDRKIQKSFAARMVSALRSAFGGHVVKVR